MTLPQSVSGIFRHKQKSYKMVLIISIIEERSSQNKKVVSFHSVKERFHNYFINEELKNNKVDKPPAGVASWRDISRGQLNDIINTPIEATDKIIDWNKTNNTIGFKPEIELELGDTGILELEQLARKELQVYNARLSKQTLQVYFEQIMDQYNTAKGQAFAGHFIGKLLRQTIPTELTSLLNLDDQYKVQGSVGQGNWATIPWLAILDKRITNSTQRGEYIVYLFSEDMSSLYLTFNQGVTEPLKLGRKDGYALIQQKIKEVREYLSFPNMNKDDHIYLGDSERGQDYQVSTIAYVKYERGNIPNDEQLLNDLEGLLEEYRSYVEHYASVQNEVEVHEVEEQTKAINQVHDEEVRALLEQVRAQILRKGFYFPDQLIENFYLSLKTKPFVILAGISGTGKTRLVKLFAEAFGATRDNGQYVQIPVRPDWNDPTELLGYKDLSGRFQPGPFTAVFVEASKPENQHKPYFICLDEMNLARVEHYFSDMLSVLESQEWEGNKIVTQSLIAATSLEDENDKQLYSNLGVPENVFIVGTVNMDETTHPFSKKVLDRANTLEFNYINLEQYPDNSNGEIGSKADDLTQLSHYFLRANYLQLVDAYDQYKEIILNTTNRLVIINSILEDIHAHVGFRVRDSICFYMIYNTRYNLMDMDEAFDWQLLQKILPRIQGSHSTVRRVLLSLMKEALGENSEFKFSISELMDDSTTLYEKWASGKTAPTAKYPQSARKLALMLRRLEEDGFTSYWLT